jgi:hypothetical protein
VQPEAEQRNRLAAAALNGSQKKLYDLLNTDQPVHIDDLDRTLRLELWLKFWLRCFVWR